MRRPATFVLQVWAEGARKFWHLMPEIRPNNKTKWPPSDPWGGSPLSPPPPGSASESQYSQTVDCRAVVGKKLHCGLKDCIVGKKQHCGLKSTIYVLHIYKCGMIAHSTHESFMLKLTVIVEGYVVSSTFNKKVLWYNFYAMKMRSDWSLSTVTWRWQVKEYSASVICGDALIL